MINLRKEVIDPYMLVWKMNNNSVAYVIFEILMRVISIIAFPVIYLFLLTIEPFKKIKFCFLYNRRFGHLLQNTDLFLRNKQLGLIPDNVYYLFFSYKPANNQIVKMFKRNMNIINNEFFYKLFAPFGFFRTRFYEPLPFSSNEDYEFNKANTSLFFTDEECIAGRGELRKMGIGENDWYVCIFARDEVYANTRFGNIDHSSTDHRNGDIDSYIDAVKYIIDKGGFVIRMGYKVSKKFGYKNPKFIDYAIKYRSDFMDIYLTANCYFFIGTSAGGSDAARVFDKPLAGVNWLPIGSAPFGKNEIFISKKVVNKDSKLPVPFERQINILGDVLVQFGSSPEDILQENNMELESNTPEEILELAKEMFDRLNKNFTSDSEYERKLKQFNVILVDSNHWCSNFKQTPGKEFLMKMELHNTEN
jgi:putative glycosyltransferase (TIGR04372 family)